MRIRRTAAEIAANIPLDQIEAHRAGSLHVTQQTRAITPEGFAVDPHAFIELLRDAPWDGGHCEYAARCIEYLLGERTQEEFERDHPNLFKKRS